MLKPPMKWKFSNDNDNAPLKTVVIAVKIDNKTLGLLYCRQKLSFISLALAEFPEQTEVDKEKNWLVYDQTRILISDFIGLRIFAMENPV